MSRENNVGKRVEFARGQAAWRWQDTHAVRSVDQMRRLLRLTPAVAARLAVAVRRQPLKITPYYLQLLDFADPGCPLRRMVIPDARELRVARDESCDPISDGGRFQPLPGLTHRHPERVLLYPTMECGGYCRYCFRRRRVGGAAGAWTDAVRRRALDYVAGHPEIREAILTGGDPLMLPDAPLLGLLRRLRRIPHLRLLRLHTRMPAFNPFRITHALARGLAALQPLWVVTHFNHPRELTVEAARGLARLRRAGVPLLNQSVLLRGVNDDARVLRELGWRLGELGVTPYYLHHPDRAAGTRHLRPALRAGRRLWRALWGGMPGHLVPQYVLDIPGGHGKVPVAAEYVSAAAPRGFSVRLPRGGGRRSYVG